MSSSIEMIEPSTRYIPILETKSENTEINRSNIFIKIISKFLFVILVAFLIFYNIIVIYTLSRVSILDENELCNKSNLWLYLLISIVPNCISFLLFSFKNKTKLDAYIAFYKLAFISWAYIEFSSINCINKLQETSLYKVCKCQFFIDFLLLNIIISKFLYYTNICRNKNNYENYYANDSFVNDITCSLNSSSTNSSSTNNKNGSILEL